MRIQNDIVAAFVGDGLDGNLAGVCLLEEWLPDPAMQAIAAFNDLPETAFVVATGETYAIRWFTPTLEANMCGHATLASVYMLQQSSSKDTYEFRSAFDYGMTARLTGGFIELDFPQNDIAPSPSSAPAQALGLEPEETLLGQSWVCRLASEAAVRNFVPDFEAIGALPEDGIIITAPGGTCDFVSRYFTPQSGIPEDPVTGYAHTLLVPYWAARLGKSELHARQISARGGELFCTLACRRVLMRGRARHERHATLTVDIATAHVVAA